MARETLTQTYDRLTRDTRSRLDQIDRARKKEQEFGFSDFRNLLKTTFATKAVDTLSDYVLSGDFMGGDFNEFLQSKGALDNQILTNSASNVNTQLTALTSEINKSNLDPEAWFLEKAIDENFNRDLSTFIEKGLVNVGDPEGAKKYKDIMRRAYMQNNKVKSIADAAYKTYQNAIEAQKRFVANGSPKDFNDFYQERFSTNLFGRISNKVRGYDPAKEALSDYKKSQAGMAVEDLAIFESIMASTGNDLVKTDTIMEEINLGDLPKPPVIAKDTNPINLGDGRVAIFQTITNQVTGEVSTKGTPTIINLNSEKENYRLAKTDFNVDEAAGNMLSKEGLKIFYDRYDSAETVTAHSKNRKQLYNLVKQFPNNEALNERELLAFNYVADQFKEPVYLRISNNNVAASEELAQFVNTNNISDLKQGDPEIKNKLSSDQFIKYEALLSNVLSSREALLQAQEIVFDQAESIFNTSIRPNRQEKEISKPKDSVTGDKSKTVTVETESDRYQNMFNFQIKDVPNESFVDTELKQKEFNEAKEDITKSYEKLNDIRSSIKDLNTRIENRDVGTERSISFLQPDRPIIARNEKEVTLQSLRTDLADKEQELEDQLDIYDKKLSAFEAGYMGIDILAVEDRDMVTEKLDPSFKKVRKEEDSVRVRGQRAVRETKQRMKKTSEALGNKDRLSKFLTNQNKEPSLLVSPEDAAIDAEIEEQRKLENLNITAQQKLDILDLLEEIPKVRGFKPTRKYFSEEIYPTLEKFNFSSEVINFIYDSLI